MVCEKSIAEIPAERLEVLILVLMEYGLRERVQPLTNNNNSCLNPCFNGIWSASWRPDSRQGRVQWSLNPCFNGIWSASWRPDSCQGRVQWSLNPCFNGIWSASFTMKTYGGPPMSLNPCFNGIWSASYFIFITSKHNPVLILVLMEYGLRGSNLRRSVYEPFTTKKTAEP